MAQTTVAHHASATKLRQLWSNESKLHKADLAYTLAFYDNERKEGKRDTWDKRDPRTEDAIQIAMLLINAAYNANYSESLGVVEGTSGKLSRFHHLHGTIYVRDMVQQAELHQVSLARLSHVIEQVLCAHFGTPVGFLTKTITNAKGWSYYMTKGWKHSDYIFGEDKREDNTHHAKVYAPCLEDAVAAEGTRANALSNRWHLTSPDTLVAMLANQLGSYLNQYRTNAVPTIGMSDTEKAELVEDWRTIVSLLRTLDRATKASKDWKKEVRKRFKVGTMGDEVEYGEYVTEKLEAAERKAKAKIERAHMKKQKTAQTKKIKIQSRKDGSVKRPAGYALDEVPVLDQAGVDELLRRMGKNPKLSMRNESQKIYRATEAKRRRQARNAERRAAYLEDAQNDPVAAQDRARQGQADRFNRLQQRIDAARKMKASADSLRDMSGCTGGQTASGPFRSTEPNAPGLYPGSTSVRCNS